MDHRCIGLFLNTERWRSVEKDEGDRCSFGEREIKKRDQYWDLYSNCENEEEVEVGLKQL